MKAKLGEVTAFIVLLLLFVVSCERPHITGSADKNEQIDRLLKQANDSVFENFEFAESRFSLAYSLVSDSLQYYEVYAKQTEFYSTTGKYDSLYSRTKRVLDFCKHVPSTPRLHSLAAMANNLFGVYFAFSKNLDSAKSYFGKAYEHGRLGKSPNDLPEICINLADSYNQSGDYVNSVFYYRKALFFTDSLKIIANTGFAIYAGLGQSYMELRDFELSNTYYTHAWRFFESRSLNEKFIYCNNRGNYYYYKGDYAAALPWFQKAKALVLPVDLPLYVNLADGNMADIYLHLDKLDSARYYLNKSLSFFQHFEDPTMLYYLHTVDLGLTIKERNFDLAKKLLTEFNDATGIVPNIVSIRNNYVENYYALTNNYKQAYQWQEENIRLNDSIRSGQIKKQVAELDLRYKQDTTLINQRAQINNQKNKMKTLQLTSIIWTLIAIAVLVFAVFIYLYKRKQQDLQATKYLSQITNLRMESIRNRISPHFIFNILHHEIGNEEDEKKHQRLSVLVKLLRQSLEMTENLSISLAQELNFVKDYLQLQQANLGADFHMQWEIDEKVNPSNVFLPAMIIQIPVENAIKHALLPLEGEKILNIAIGREGSGILIVVRDNGPGYNSAKSYSSNGTGTGMKVLHQTIQLLNSRNKGKITLTIEDLKDTGITGTKVGIIIPDQYSFRL